MKKIRVSTANSYDIVIENDFHGLSVQISQLFPFNRSIFIISDKNVGSLFGEELKEILQSSYKSVYFFSIEAGESSKNLETLSLVFNFLLENGADRSSVIIALGGGVIGDLAGFAASAYMRGIAYVQIPTTLLAQVDSSVGGKTAVDFLGYKNIIGAFYQPSLVYINIEALSFLPQREFSGGMAEVVKYGLIADKDFYRFIFNNIEQIHDRDILTYLVSRCVELKAAVVAEDERDTGLREILNYGHTIGHAVESLSNFQLLHGECVALGMLASMEISRSRGKISGLDLEEYKSLITRLALPLQIRSLSFEKIYEAMQKDKKKKADGISFVLLEGIGRAYPGGSVTPEEIMNAVDLITNGG